MALLLFVPAFSIFFSVLASADADDALLELNDILPDEVKEALPDEAEEHLKNGDAESLVRLIDCEFVLNLAGKTVTGLFGEAAKQTARIISIVLCSAILRSVCSELEDKAICKALGSVCGICIILVMIKALTAVFDRMSLAVTAVGAFSGALSPLICALCISGGCSTVGSVTASFLSLLTTLLEEATRTVLTPFLKIGICMTAVSTLSSFDLSAIVDFVKKTFITIITFSMTLLTAVMAYQSTLAQSVDSMLLRTVKFAVGNVIPIVGASVGEAASGVLSGVAAIKTAIGGVGAIAVVLIVLPPIVHILLLKIGIWLASAVAAVFGCAGEGKLINDIGSLLDLALALISSCSVMFVISLAMLSRAVAV